MFMIYFFRIITNTCSSEDIATKGLTFAINFWMLVR